VGYTIGHAMGFLQITEQALQAVPMMLGRLLHVCGKFFDDEE